MRDEIYDRDYQAGRAEFHAGIDRLVLRLGRTLGATFDAIHDIQFAAPWRRRARGHGRRAGTA
jgi:hypothetical protein